MAVTAPEIGLRRGARRIPRIDTRLVIGVVLVAIAVVGGLRFAAAADATVGVVAVARDLPANHVIASGDLRVVRIHGSDAVLSHLVRSDGAGALRGRVLLYPVAAGGLVDRAAVALRPRAGREITVPITPEHALGGKVRPGDRVDVLASFTKGTSRARTVTVVDNAEVVDVVRADALFASGDGALSAVTLSVPPADAVFLAFALQNADLDIVRTTGSPAHERATVDGTQLK